MIPSSCSGQLVAPKEPSRLKEVPPKGTQAMDTILLQAPKVTDGQPPADPPSLDKALASLSSKMKAIEDLISYKALEM